MITPQQVIVGAAVTQDGNDVRQLHPMVEEAEANLRAAGVGDRIREVVGDAGYWSEENVRKAEEKGLEMFIAPMKGRKLRALLAPLGVPRGRLPGGLSLRGWIERRLRSRRGREVYALRGKTVEAVFGQIKGIRGCDRFLQRGRSACDGEWKVICLTHNLLKLWRWMKEGLGSGRRPSLAAA